METSNKEKSNTKNLMKEQLLHTQYLNDLVQSSRYTKTETDFIKEIGTPELDFYYIKYSFSDYPSKDIITYGTKNIKLFRQIKLSRITIKSSKSDADRILQQLRSNENLFEELARSLSQDAFADKGGEMGWHQYFALESYFDSTEDLDSVFLLKTGEMSNVISTASGWMIYRCDESASTPDLTNKEELNTIRSYIERFERGIIEDYLVDKADGFKLSAEKIGFEKACLKEGIEYNKTGYFPIIFGNPSFNSSYGEIPLFKQTPIQGASSSEYFLKELSSIKQGELSNAIILDNNVFILKLVDEKEADQKNNEMTGFYYPYAIQTWQQEELTNLIMDSDKLENNFNEVFSRYFLSE